MKIEKDIIGKNIYLRSLSLKDVTQNYLKWLQDNEVNYFLETRHEKQRLKKIKAFEKVGFVKEALRVKHYKLESNFIDVIELGLLREEYKK